MKTLRNSSILMLVIAIISCSEQKASKPTTTLVTGENVAVTNTQSGKVRGYIHNNIYTYKGIPYAQAERFMAPEKVTSWEGVRSSMSYGPVCPLLDPTTTVNDESEFVFNHNWGYANENCLNLNVWTPGISNDKKRPVMVWLHGGGHVAGSSIELPSYDGENLSKSGDVVVVSINHRLNVLGFLNLTAYGDKYKASANASILDIVAALQWVKDNIANFGGDPDNVLIFGQSGGGGKVNTLLNMPAAKGLFHKAVIQSGGLGLQFASNETTQKITAVVLEELKLKPAQVDSIQKVPFAHLSAAGKKAIAKVAAQLRAEGVQLNPVVGLSWGPVQDGYSLPYQPTDAEAQALSKDIPVMIGSTKNEFITSLWRLGQSDMSQDSVMSFIKKTYGDKADDYVAAVKKAYPNDTRPTDLIDVDAMFRRSAIRMADIKAKSGSPIYMYLFTWQSPVLDGKYKAVHCMEIPFVFNNIARCEEMTGGTGEAYALADKVSKAWINFAKTGNPNHSGLPKWDLYTPEGGATMIFDNTCELKNNHDKDYLAITPEVVL